MFLAVMRPLDGNTMHVPVEVCYSKFLRRLRQAQPWGWRTESLGSASRQAHPKAA